MANFIVFESRGETVKTLLSDEKFATQMKTECLLTINKSVCAFYDEPWQLGKLLFLLSVYFVILSISRCFISKLLNTHGYDGKMDARGQFIRYGSHLFLLPTFRIVKYVLRLPERTLEFKTLTKTYIWLYQPQIYLRHNRPRRNRKWTACAGNNGGRRGN